MIKINLLPFRIARKKENIRKQISIFFLLIFLASLILFWYAQYMNRRIQTVEDEIQQVNAQIALYKEKANRVEQIKKDLKALDDKLGIVDSLNKQKDKQLVLFDSMTALVVPDRMWLEYFKTDQNTVIIKGIAYDNPTIADFMEKLEKSPLFTKVDLKTAQMRKFKDGIMLKSFELLCTKRQPQDETKDSSKQGKK